jgi:hypothetical protein
MIGQPRPAADPPPVAKSSREASELTTWAKNACLGQECLHCGNAPMVLRGNFGKSEPYNFEAVKT